MDYPFYHGDRKTGRTEIPAPLPVSKRSRSADPHEDDFADGDRYQADEGLVNAVNVSLLLAQPLLLTGKPGTGKTKLAFSLAWELGFKPPLQFDTKSGSTAGDLLYTFDTLRRFQDAQNGTADPGALNYVHYGPLGEAILRSREKSDVEHLLPPGFEHNGRRRSVVLIDEVDKAPRDFPNDLLNELDNMSFRIAELDNSEVRASADLSPIVVITSNSEKDLPDAFLRRCVYYNIPFPDDDRLDEIIAMQLELADDSQPFRKTAIELFRLLRSTSVPLRKQPATAELIGWIRALRGISDADNPLDDNPELARTTISALIKTTEDIPLATQVVDDWIAGRNAGGTGDPVAGGF